MDRHSSTNHHHKENHSDHNIPNSLTRRMMLVGMDRHIMGILPTTHIRHKMLVPLRLHQHISTEIHLHSMVHLLPWLPQRHRLIMRDDLQRRVASL